jgi:sugar lactone lactonase YvrE
VKREAARRVATGVVAAAVLGAGWVATRPVWWVRTLSGGGQAGYADGPVASARWYVPTGLALDTSTPERPLLYVADTYNHRIRVIDLDAPGGAMVSTLAGHGGLGFSSGASLDGPALQASFNFPRDLVLDGKGSLYVLDTTGNRVRRIGLKEPGQPVTTIAGGKAGYRDGPGTTARFHAPWGLAYDGAGALIVADTYNNCIRRIELANPAHPVTTLAGRLRGYADGTGRAAAFKSPAAVTVDVTSRPMKIYVADGSNRCIRLLETGPGGAKVTTLGGAPMPASDEDWWVDVPLIYPAGITAGPAGDLWVADQAANVLYRVTPAGRLTVMAGDAGAPPGRRDGPTFWARFGQLSGVAQGADGTLYVADSVNNAIRALR